MTLQLYQVDYKSYLLDFKSLASNEEETNEISLCASAGSGSNSSDPYNQSQCHHIMEFFEMCASLITQLAR